MNLSNALILLLIIGAIWRLIVLILKLTEPDNNPSYITSTSNTIQDIAEALQELSLKVSETEVAFRAFLIAFNNTTTKNSMDF